MTNMQFSNLDELLKHAKTPNIGRDKTKTVIEKYLGREATEDELNWVCHAFDSYNMLKIIRNRLGNMTSQIKKIESLMRANIIDFAEYSGYRNSCKVADKVLLDLGLSPNDFDNDGWYKHSASYIRAQYYNRIAEENL